MSEYNLVAIDKEILENLLIELHEACALASYDIEEDEYNKAIIKYVKQNLKSRKKYNNGAEALIHIANFDLDVLTEKGVTII